MSGLTSEYLQNDQIFRASCENFRPIGRQMQHILDTHAEFAGQIDAGLCGDDGVLRQLCVRAGRGDGVLVDVEPEAVSEAVTEAVPVARIGDDLARGGVHTLAGHAGLCRGNAGQLRVEHGLVHGAHLVARHADGDGARHVRAVAVFAAAEVHRHKVALCHAPVAGHAVRHARVRSGEHDGVKARALRAEAQHAVNELGRDLPLGHAGADDGADLRKRLVRDLLRLIHHRQLLRLLGCAQGAQDALCRLELEPEQLLVGREFGVARRLLLTAEQLHVCLAQNTLHERAHRRLARAQQHLRDAGQRGVCGLDVAGVGDEKCLMHRHDHRAVRGREAGGEPAVVFVGEQDGVQMRLSQRALDAGNVDLSCRF